MTAAMQAPNETEFLRQVTELAEMLGWRTAHFRPARTAHGWRTPVQGSLGKGFPDLVMLRRDRVLFVELKGHKGVLSAEQAEILALLDQAAEAYCWHPEQLDEIAAVLR